MVGWFRVCLQYQISTSHYRNIWSCHNVSAVSAKTAAVATSRCNVDKMSSYTVLSVCRENMAKGGGICVANHTSPVDIAVLGCDNCYAMVCVCVRVCCLCVGSRQIIALLAPERRVYDWISELVACGVCRWDRNREVCLECYSRHCRGRRTTSGLTDLRPRTGMPLPAGLLRLSGLVSCFVT